MPRYPLRGKPGRPARVRRPGRRWLPSGQPIYFMDPNGESSSGAKSDWNGAGTSWDLTDDGVRQWQGAPATGDKVTAPSANAIDRLDTTTFTLPSDKMIDWIRYWVYVETFAGQGGIRCMPWVAGGIPGFPSDPGFPLETISDTGAGEGWYSKLWQTNMFGQFSGTAGDHAWQPSQTDINNFMIDRRAGANGTTEGVGVVVRAEYLEVALRPLWSVVILDGYGIAHTRAMGTPSVSPSLGPSSIVVTRAIGAAKVNPSLAPASIVHDRAVGAPVVSPGVAPASIVHGRAMGDPSVQLETLLEPASIVHTRAIGAPVVSPGLGPGSIVHTRGQGSPAVSPALGPASIVHTRGIGTPAVSNTTSLAPDAIVHARAMGAPELDVALGGSAIVHSRAMGQPALAVSLGVPSIVHARELGSPSIPGGPPLPRDAQLLLGVGGVG